jgi:putative FmdB family regulatory protein
MAAYDYRCRSCDTVFEIRRGIAEPADEVRCPDGHPDVARMWSATAVVGAGRAPAPAPAGGGCCGGGCCG